MITDKERLDFIQERSRYSRVGISFLWDGQDRYQFMSDDHLMEGEDVREAIDKSINERAIVRRK